VLARARRAKVPAEAVLDTDDSPADALVRIARNEDCDLIVMASSSRAGLERIFLGSVASEVLSGTKTPVLVCH
jgi:nucleotide-binding universal stress UspA family protein